MKKIDYSKLSEITVKTQKELDRIPDDFRGSIYVESDQDTCILLSKNYLGKVYAYNHTYIKVIGDAHIHAHHDTLVKAFDNACVVADDVAKVFAFDNTVIEATDRSCVIACDATIVNARGNSKVYAYGNSAIYAQGNSHIQAEDDSNIEATDLSRIDAYGRSHVIATNWSTVRARESSKVEACGNVQIIKLSDNTKLKISKFSNARIVQPPKSIIEFLDFEGIKHTNTKAIMYKVVCKIDGKYVSDYDRSFCYEIGKIKKEICDPNLNKLCASGIHIAPLRWVLNYSKDMLADTAILEVETNIADIVLPTNSDGKVRTSRVKVLREVPFEECGIYGKILAKSYPKVK